MSEELINRLKSEGAEYLAMITTQESVKSVFGHNINVYHLKDHPWKVLVKDLSY